MNFITLREQGGQRFNKFFPAPPKDQKVRVAFSFDEERVFMAVDGKTNSVTEQVSNVNLQGLRFSGPVIITDFKYFSRDIYDKQVLDQSIQP
jgi:hypothetical protein